VLSLCRSVPATIASACRSIGKLLVSLPQRRHILSDAGYGPLVAGIA
jgi:hypothetical protein